MGLLWEDSPSASTALALKGSEGPPSTVHLSVDPGHSQGALGKLSSLLVVPGLLLRVKTASALT
jgi:hypothetical protein